MKYDSREIAARAIDKHGRGRKCFEGNTRKQTPIIGAFAEPLSDLMGYGGTETGMIEDRGGQRASKYRVVGQSRLGVAPDPAPHFA